MTKLTYSIDQCIQKLKLCFSDNSLQISDEKVIPYGKQFRVSDGQTSSTLRVYHSKKKGTSIDYSTLKPDSFKQFIIPIVEHCFGQSSLPLRAAMPTDRDNTDPDTLIGTDESGKGDYFGPLVIAGVFVDKEKANMLRSIGVQDSKKLSDSQCKALAEKIRAFPHSTVVIGPEKYNELYDNIKNLNKLLAWGHARVIENILELVDCPDVLSDQFGDESLIQNALMEKGKGITLRQRPRAEENIAVAAASILARDGFLAFMDHLSLSYRMTFPKGANPHVITSGKKLVATYGNDVLRAVAKLHFKTTQQVMD